MGIIELAHVVTPPCDGEVGVRHRGQEERGASDKGERFVCDIRACHLEREMPKEEDGQRRVIRERSWSGFCRHHFTFKTQIDSHPSDASAVYR